MCRTFTRFSQSRREFWRLKISSKQTEHSTVPMGAALLYSLSVGHIAAKFEFEHLDFCFQQNSRLYRFPIAASWQTTSRSRCNQYDVLDADSKSKRESKSGKSSRTTIADVLLYCIRVPHRVTGTWKQPHQRVNDNDAQLDAATWPCFYEEKLRDRCESTKHEPAPTIEAGSVIRWFAA